MQKIIISILMLFSIDGIHAQQADDIIGTYRLPNNLDIEISKVDGKYQGEIVGVHKDSDDESLIGKVIIHNLEFDSKIKNWVNGTMYSPKKGLTFSLKVTEMRENEIEVVGSKFFFWHTITWKRI